MNDIYGKVLEVFKTLTFPFPYSLKEWSENLWMENYHCHKDFTNICVPDCTESIENYAKRTVEYGDKCLFSGEHGTQGNQFAVYKVAEEYKLKYRHSAEAYFVKDRHDKDRTNAHVMIVAKTAEGRKDLNYILSVANEDGYYYQPRIDLDLLLSVDPKNLIVTTACIGGVWKYEDYEDLIVKMRDHFQENFFLEVQNHNTPKQKELNKIILELSRKYDIPLICGLDSHYVLEENRIKREIYQKERHILYNDDEEGWFMDFPDGKEVIKRFEEQGVLSDEEILQSMMNTTIFIDECEEIVFDKHFKIPNIYKDLDYQGRVKLLQKKLSAVYKTDPRRSKEKAQGIKWEVSQFAESGTVDYPLISEALVHKAVHGHGGVLTTTSRGSAGSFLTNSMIGLSTIDRFNADIPIYPERFLTKERVLSGQCPDVDLNIYTQEPFVQAARDLLGEHGCYPLMARATLKEKSAWAMYARVNGVSAEQSQVISKALDRFEADKKYASEEEADSIVVENYVPEEYIDLYKESKSYQGITIGSRIHACGHLIFDGDIRREIGLISAKSESTGKRTLVCATEGKYLDEFGYVKEDFLIVDVVGLVYKLWNFIGEKVPTFEELKELVKGDQPTWDIYKNGITVAVNQCERKKTTEKVKRYKPQNIAELAMFIAGVRPGFASLIDNFISRKPYSTGEREIDKVLDDTNHYMIFQESIMKVLSFLGVDMAETYGVIKAISKKKLFGEKRDNLMNQLKENWLKIFGNLDNFGKVWKVVEDAASYSFNSCHAYAMAGDSLYIAWFKAHHTAAFYEVAISHYQEKNKKDKVNALIKEIIEKFGYKKGDYQFGLDGRKVVVDEQNKTIYPNLSSLKGFGEKTVNDLYELGQKPANTFIDVLKNIEGTSIKKNHLTALIGIGYFSKFGNQNYLYEVARIYDGISTLKTRVSISTLQKLGFDSERAKEYGKSTGKAIGNFDKEGFMKDCLANIRVDEPTLREKCDWQYEYSGSLWISNPDADGKLFYCTGLETRKKLAIVELYRISTGKTYSVKIFNGAFRDGFKAGDLLKIPKFERRQVNKPTNKLDENGKPIWAPVPGEYEHFIKNYEVM